MIEKCENCKYWKHEGRIDDELTLGECRRKPPKLNAREMHSFDSLDAPEEARWMATIFPMTDNCAWCGEWKARD